MASANDRAKKLLPWLALLIAGLGFGAWLGGAIVADVPPVGGAVSAPYADLSGNPAAATADAQRIAPCDNCADGYGSAGRAFSDDRPNDDASFRALGQVNSDDSVFPEPADDYRYGGRFPETAGPATAPPAADKVIADPEKGLAGDPLIY